jgi:hypothetical protein
VSRLIPDRADAGSKRSVPLGSIAASSKSRAWKEAFMACSFPASGSFDSLGFQPLVGPPGFVHLAADRQPGRSKLVSGACGLARLICQAGLKTHTFHAQ